MNIESALAPYAAEPALRELVAQAQNLPDATTDARVVFLYNLVRQAVQDDQEARQSLERCYVHSPKTLAECVQLAMQRRMLQPAAQPAALSRKEIYRQIASCMCRVQTEVGSATALRLGEDLIALPFPDTLAGVACLQGEERLLGEPCMHEGMLALARRLDCAIFQVSGFSGQVPLSLFTGEIEVGEEVYFGGFPVGEPAPSFHAGFVASVQRGEVCRFTIDRVALSGLEGSPVFCVQEGNFKLCGVLQRGGHAFHAKHLLDLLKAPV